MQICALQLDHWEFKFVVFAPFHTVPQQCSHGHHIEEQLLATKWFTPEDRFQTSTKRNQLVVDTYGTNLPTNHIDNGPKKIQNTSIFYVEWSKKCVFTFTDKTKKKKCQIIPRRAKQMLFKRYRLSFYMTSVTTVAIFTTITPLSFIELISPRIICKHYSS